MRRDGNGRERGPSHDAGANDNAGPQARIEDAVMRLARFHQPLAGCSAGRSRASGSRQPAPPTTTRRKRRRTTDRRPETMTLRAALYARYSSDQQRAVSIDDQFRNRAHPRREARRDARRAPWRSGHHHRMGRRQGREEGDRHPARRNVGLSGSGGRIRTCDLRVMSPTSCQTAPPRTWMANDTKTRVDVSRAAGNHFRKLGSTVKIDAARDARPA